MTLLACHIWHDTVRVGCIDHRSNVYPALQVMVLVNKRRDRSMVCVLSHVNTPPSYIDLLLLNAILQLNMLTTHVLSDSSERLLTQVEVKYRKHVQMIIFPDC